MPSEFVLVERFAKLFYLPFLLNADGESTFFVPHYDIGKTITVYVSCSIAMGILVPFTWGTNFDELPLLGGIIPIGLALAEVFIAEHKNLWFIISVHVL